MMHKVPLFLELEDKFLLGLTMRQCLLLFVGAGVSYMVFFNIFGMIADPTTALVVGLAVALLCFSGVLAIAFLQLGGRGLEEWGLVLLVYLSQPKMYTWHFNAPDAFERLDWAALERNIRTAQEQEGEW